MTRAALRLAAGVVALEFAAAVSSFVSATLLPTVATALDARAHLGLLLAGPTLGLFVALPLAPAVLHRIGPRRTLAAGMVAYLAGAVVSATAVSAWVYAGGRFVGGLAQRAAGRVRGQRGHPGAGRAGPGPGGGGVVGDVDPAGVRRPAGHAGAGARGRLAVGAARPGADRAGRPVPRRRGRDAPRRTSRRTGRWGARCWSRPGWRCCWPPARRCWSRPGRWSRWSAWPGCCRPAPPGCGPGRRPRWRRCCCSGPAGSAPTDWSRCCSPTATVRAWAERPSCSAPRRWRGR